MRERMKRTPLWMRIYLMVFGLVTVVIVFVSYRIIEVSIEYNLQREISSSLENHSMIGNSLKMYESTIDDYYPTLLKDILTKSFQNYGQYFTDQRSHLAITGESGEKHFSSISNEEEKVMSLVPPKDGRRSYVIRNIDARTVLFVSSWMKMDDQLLRLDYAHDITSLIDDQKSLSLQISFWVLVGLMVFAVGLYVLIRQALRPLGLLSKQAQGIAKGSYQHRITVQHADEIGQLAVDFNYMAEAIQSNMELLQRGVTEREEFIASLAHEFKTPLTSIMGYASLLQNYHLEEKDVEQALRFIHSESKRLDGMSKKLLELFRLGNGEPPNKQQVDVSSLMQQLKIISHFTLDSRGQTLEIAYSVSTVTVDPELYLVLLSNLVENASKASENDTVIRLDVYVEDSFVVFCVEDHGCGVPEEHLANVFQPFFMLDSSRDRKKNGHGLGLSLCKAIATAHYGSIYMKSRLNGGTSVYTKVPVQTST